MRGWGGGSGWRKSDVTSGLVSCWSECLNLFSKGFRCPIGFPSSFRSEHQDSVLKGVLSQVFEKEWNFASFAMSGKTIMLTYLGSDIGEEGCFSDATKWFDDGSKLVKPEYTIVDDDVKELETTSEMMKNAIVESFPIPKFPEAAHTCMKGKETDYILNVFADRSQTQTIEAMDKFMRPGREGYKVRGQTFYLLGPFHRRKELLER